jgi:hypothetical protein
VDSEGNKSSVSEVRRMMVRMFKELKRTYKNNSMNPKRIWIKKQKTQKQLNEPKKDFSKHWNETKKTMKKR